MRTNPAQRHCNLRTRLASRLLLTAQCRRKIATLQNPSSVAEVLNFAFSWTEPGQKRMPASTCSSLQHIKQLQGCAWLLLHLASLALVNSERHKQSCCDLLQSAAHFRILNGIFALRTSCQKLARMQVSTLRLALAWTLLCSRHVVHTLPSLQPASWPELATKAAKCSSEPHPTMLLVLDPNGILCWENVAINAFTNATLLPWLHEQRDALTLGADRQGIHIEASFWPAGLLQHPNLCLLTILHAAYAFCMSAIQTVAVWITSRGTG